MTAAPATAGRWLTAAGWMSRLTASYPAMSALAAMTATMRMPARSSARP